MPKKPPRNAFYFFMQDYKEVQRQKGISYANMAEVAEAAGPVWQNAPPTVRKKFENMAKQAKVNTPSEKKYTSTGIPLDEVERQEQELREAEEYESNDITNLVNLKAFSKTILKENFYIMDVNIFCKVGNQYFIGESTLLRFNLHEGIKDNYHEHINPGFMPTGYTRDVLDSCKEFGLKMPDPDEERSDYMQILANMIDYLKRQDKNAKTLPPIFTMPDKVAPVRDFIMQMCNRAAEDDSLFRVYKLDKLFYKLINAVKSNSDEGFPRESLALAQLNKDNFKYAPELGCEHHEKEEKSPECTTSRVKRWAFTILDSCSPVAGIEAVPGKHLPFDADVDVILACKDLKKERMRASVAVNPNVSLDRMSVLSDSYSEANTSAASVVDVVKKEKRVHIPLRMPKQNYSQQIKAPQLTETNFPSLSVSHGRGRGLAGSLNKLKIEK